MFNTGFNKRSRGGSEGGAAGAALCLFLLLPLIWNPFGGASLSEIPKWIWLALIVTVSLAAVYPGSSDKNTAAALPRTIKILGAAWLGSGLLSVLLSKAPITSLYGSYQGQNGFITSLLVATMLVVLHQLFTRLRNKNLFLRGVEIVGVTCALYALWQFINLDFSSPLSDGRIFAGRVYGFFSNPNDFGQYLIFPFFASATLLAQSVTRTKARIRSQIILHILAMVLISIALFLTMNRASWLGILAGGLLFTFLTFRQYVRPRIKARIKTGIKKRTLVLIVLGIITTAALLCTWLQNTQIRSLQSRQVLWQSSLELVPQTPIFGFGQATFPSVIQQTLPADIYEFEPLMAVPNRAHNLFLELFLEQGIIGLAVTVLLLVVIMRQGFLSHRERRPVYALSTLTAALVSLQFGYAQITTTFFMVASLAIITANGENAHRISHTLGVFLQSITSHITSFQRFLNKKTSGGGGLAAAAGILILALVFLWHGARMMQFEALLGEGMRAAILQPQSAHNPLSKLLKEQPPFAYPYEVAFTMLESRFRNEPQLVQAFEPYTEKYGEITGHNYQYHAYKGMFAYFKKDEITAREQYEKALNMAPNSMRVITGWALSASKAGDTESFEILKEKFENRLPSFIREDTGQEQLLKKREIFFKSNPVYFQMKEAEQD